MQESRRQRARRLGRESWALLSSDRRLVVFPLVSATLGLLLGAASFAVSDGLVGGSGHSRRVLVLGGIIASYPVTFVTLFTGVALATVLAGKLDGRAVSASDGWRAARGKLGLIAAWTILVCTVGGILRLVEERVPLGGKIAALVVDLSWSLATMFAVPVLAYEDLGPRATLRRSAAIFRERWGEQVGGVVTIELGTAVLIIPAVLLIVAGLAIGGAVGVALVLLGAAAALAVQAFSAALNQVYRVFLYRSAIGIEPVGGPFSPTDLDRPVWGKKAEVRERRPEDLPDTAPITGWVKRRRRSRTQRQD